MILLHSTQGRYCSCPLHICQVPFLHLGMVRHTAEVTCSRSLPGQLVDLNSQPLGPKSDALPTELSWPGLISDGNTHILNLQTILYVVTVPVISSICSENILNFQYWYS